METAIAVLTRESAQGIVERGGSASWALNPINAMRQRYLVCCRNAPDAATDAEEPHGAAFLVGVINDILPVGETLFGRQMRYRIDISECTRVRYLNVWGNWRNPVRYTSLEELGIDVSALRFTDPDDALTATPVEQVARPAPREVRKLTMSEAKAGLAAALGVSPEAIEIIIRG